MSNGTTRRPLHVIAEEINKDMARLPTISNAVIWTQPYRDAMATMTNVSDMYGLDSGDSIVRYFLSNAAGWRGEVARRIKAELKSMIH